VKTRLNLAARPFPRYRRTNRILAGVFIAALGAGALQVLDFVFEPPDVGTLVGTERALRVEWEDLGRRIAEVEGRLRLAEAGAEMPELMFLSQVMARKQFSWTLMLREIERVIPTSVYLDGLIPKISEEGQVSVQMEARGRTIGDVSQFIENLELTDAFSSVKAFESEDGIVDGRPEVRVVMGADYIAATLTEVGVPGE